MKKELMIAVVLGLTLGAMVGCNCPSKKEKHREAYAEYKADVPPEVSRPSSGPPEKALRVEIRGEEAWHIKFTTNLHCLQQNWEGWTDNATKTIWIDVMPDEDMKNIVLHELMHVAYDRDPTHVFMDTDLETENTFVQPTAPRLRAILEDNPELRQWLFEE